jgi:hypothetical protein
VAKKLTRKTRTTTETTVEAPGEDIVVEKPAAPPAGIESWLIFVTFFALLAAFVLINMKMRATFGEGWPV